MKTGWIRGLGRPFEKLLIRPLISFSNTSFLSSAVLRAQSTFFSPPSLARVYHCLYFFLRESMATVPITVPSLKGFGVSSPAPGRSQLRYGKPFVVRAATVLAPKYTAIKPVGNRVLVKIKTGEEKTTGGLYLPTAAQKKSQEGEVVAIGDGSTIGGTKVDLSVQKGNQVIYSRYAGTELEFDGENHLLLKEDDIIGILETDDIKDLKPLGDRLLIQVAEAEEKTAGGLFLTEQTKEKPSIGNVVAVGPGEVDEDGKRKPIDVASGSTVLYSKYAGSEFKGPDGTNYIALKVSDVLAVLS